MRKTEVELHKLLKYGKIIKKWERRLEGACQKDDDVGKAKMTPGTS